MGRAPLFQWTYTALWLIRIWFALYGTGYIHPDEYMQNGEITAGNVLGFHTLTTWEWDSKLPVRSILPVFATTGLPLLVLRLLFGPQRLAFLRPSLVFRIQRLTFVCLSGILDYSILILVSQSAHRRLALLLLASSYVTCTFQIRPFSNSLESILLSLCLVLLRQIVNKRIRLKRVDEKNQVSHLTHALKRDLHLLAALAVVGTFTRPTFVAFALPIAYRVLRISYQVAGSPARAIGLLLPPFCTAALTASLFIAADTYYFRGDFFQLIVTPYNFLKYNLSTDNLAEHGLHPNWLHVGVNLPMLLGPLLGWWLWSSLHPCLKLSRCRIEKVRIETEIDIIRQSLIQVMVLSLSVLSAQPHQEPRFLTPLILPIIVLASTAESPSTGSLFWVTWAIFNVTLALVFGFLHQGGVVPSLFALHSTLRNTTAGSSAHIVYWKTYMPPRHLLGMSQGDVMSGHVSITDLAGAPRTALIAALSAPSFKLTYLATPMSVFLSLPHDISSCMALETSVFPHLDLDHIHESVRTGGVDGLRLGVYAVERRCIVDASTAQAPGT